MASLFSCHHGHLLNDDSHIVSSIPLSITPLSSPLGKKFYFVRRGHLTPGGPSESSHAPLPRPFLLPAARSLA